MILHLPVIPSCEIALLNLPKPLHHALPLMEDQMETFLERYMENADSDLDFESKKGYSDQFQSFRRMPNLRTVRGPGRTAVAPMV